MQDAQGPDGSVSLPQDPALVKMNTQMAFDEIVGASAQQGTSPVPGLQYVASWLDAEYGARLIDHVDKEPWMTSMSRRVQHYGWRYNYKARSVGPDSRIGPLPDWLGPLAVRLFAEGTMERVPDQAIVNEYQPGQGIAAHVDCPPCFGPVVAMLSLSSAIQMDFSALDGSAQHALALAPNSLLVLAGESRYRWRHRIAKRRRDPSFGIVRTRRVSITFRTVVSPR